MTLLPSGSAAVAVAAASAPSAASYLIEDDSEEVENENGVIEQTMPIPLSEEGIDCESPVMIDAAHVFVVDDDDLEQPTCATTIMMTKKEEEGDDRTSTEETVESAESPVATVSTEEIVESAESPVATDSAYEARQARLREFHRNQRIQLIILIIVVSIFFIIMAKTVGFWFDNSDNVLNTTYEYPTIDDCCPFHRA